MLCFRKCFWPPHACGLPFVRGGSDPRRNLFLVLNCEDRKTKHLVLVRNRLSQIDHGQHGEHKRLNNGYAKMKHQEERRNREWDQ